MNQKEFLKELIGIYSPTGNTGKAVEFLAREMKKLGFESKIDEVGNAIGIIGNGNTKIVFIGHVDTVNGKIPLEENGGKIYGRGTVDAKGPLAAFILAASKFRESNNIKITVCAAMDEEGPSLGTKHFLENAVDPDFVIIGEPSSWEKITIGYKGILRVKFTSESEESHSSSGKETSIEETIKFWNAMAMFRDEYSKGKGIFDSLQLSAREINSASDGFKIKTGITINARLPPEFDPENLIKSIKYSAKGNLKILEHIPAFVSGKNNVLVRAFMESIRENNGNFGFKLKTGTADFNIAGLKWTKPIIAYGPGDSNLDHTPNENLDLKEFEKSIKVLEMALEKLGTLS